MGLQLAQRDDARFAGDLAGHCSIARHQEGDVGERLFDGAKALDQSGDVFHAVQTAAIE